MLSLRPHRLSLFWLVILLAAGQAEAQPPATPEVQPEGEDFFFVPPGFARPGVPMWADESASPVVKIRVRDASDGQLTPCRVNVVGSDGNYYQPQQNPLSPYALTGEWPKDGAWGNRRDKAPYRYLGRFFYMTGEIDVAVPPGLVRIEVSKGFEYRPVVTEVNVAAGGQTDVEVVLRRTLTMSELGWHSGDPHLHIPRTSAQDEAVIFDLLRAEDIRYGSLLGYNEPAGPYAGFMDKFAAPQFHGLGRRSIVDRGPYHIMSGQEYRTSTYGHLLIFNRDDLVFPGETFNADRWPVYGLVGRQTQELGGFAFYAHGGYRQEIYADAALGAVDGVELLQFGIYRELGLEDWYHMLNSGYRFPCMGASDWPACRNLGDCRTYIQAATEPDFAAWLATMSAGRSFVTTGPMLLLQLDGKHSPGDVIRLPKSSSQTFQVTLRLACEVTPVQRVELIVNGQVHKSFEMESAEREPSTSPWREFTVPLEVDKSAWVAARAWSTTPGGRPDAEAHTNPIYIYFGDRVPYQQASLDAWIARLDEQMAKQRQRDFPEKSRVLDYFQKARDLLLGIRERGGLKADERPVELGDALLSAAGSQGLGQDASLPEPTAAELRAFLQPVPPKAPQDAARAMDVAEGFEMQLVAAEPLVYDPVAAAFDEDGQLYVCEMRDYPFKPQAEGRPRGSVRLLRDTDGDGVFDQSTVFADELLWAAGVVPWRGGVFVAASPDIWYLKDHDGDGRADERRRVFTGFGTGNQQAMVNNLTWGLDHKIYGSTAGNGGAIQRVDRPDAPVIDVSGRDFRFDPQTLEFETLAGTVQFGNTFDDWGNRFVCSESQPLQHVVLPQHYLSRNPWLPVPRAIHNIAPGPVPIFRISPIERWRQIRSSRRIAKNERAATSAGASHHVVDAAAGVTIYRGGAYPESFYGTVFVGDGQNNLIHHRRLIPQGVTFTSERTREGTEIVRSPDIWFRPVNFLNAPDGTLYCLDMSREVLESIHIPLDVVQHLDLASGRDHGRIYRLAPRGFRIPPAPRLSQAEPAELVAALESPHGWWRDTAFRLIHERQDMSLVPPLRTLLHASPRPHSRLLALRSLEGLGRATEDDVIMGLLDTEPQVAAASLPLAERRFEQSPRLLEAALELAEAPHPRVQFQLAFSLGATRDPRATAVLADILKRHLADPWMRTAVLSSALPRCDSLLLELLEVESVLADAGGFAALEHLTMLVGAQCRGPELERVLSAFAAAPQLKSQPDRQQALLLALGTGLLRAGSSLAQQAQGESGGAELVRQLLSAARRNALDRQSADAARIGAIRLLGLDSLAENRELLAELLLGDPSPDIRIATVQTLAAFPDLDVAENFFVAPWRQFTPDLRTQIVRACLARDSFILEFLQAAARGEVTTAEFEPAQRQRLLEHRSADIRELATRLWGQANTSPRGAIVAEYTAAVGQLSGAPERGRQVFAKSCAACHRLEQTGVDLGPNLASSAHRDTETLLSHILDPNRYVLPNYLQYTVVDLRGRTYQGLIAAQTANSISLRSEKNQVETLLRSDIEELFSSGKSLMPEGLERDIPPQAMADLISYLQTALATPVDAGQSRQTRDFGTLPGLIEPP